MARGASGCSAAAEPAQGGESHRFNMFPGLARIQCPTLVLSGEDDPNHPIESQADIVAALPPRLVQFERFNPNVCGQLNGRFPLLRCCPNCL